MSSGSDFVSSVLRSATYEASCRLYRCPNAASAQPGGCCNRNAAASRTTHLRTESIRSARCRKREPGHSKRAGRWVAGAPNVGSVSATRGLQLGPIEHRLETIALDDSDDYFADDLAHLHVPQPCLDGELPHHVLSERYFSRSLLASVLHLQAEAHRTRFICSRLRMVKRRDLSLLRWRGLQGRLRG